jgi:hypothetical protein
MTTTRRDTLRVTAAPLLVLAVLLFIPAQRAAGSANGVGTASGGGTILFSRQNHWYTIAPNGTHLHLLLSNAADCTDFGCAAFSPDGTRIMVAAHSANTMQVATSMINTSGSGYHALPLPDRTLNLAPGAWAPDGTRAALRGWDDANKARAGIYAVNSSDGKGLVRLTTSPDGHNDDPLAYSPNGSRLLFYHEGAQGSSQPRFGGLFETSATGAGRVKLNPPGTSVTADFGSPASWSPDSKQITFTAFDDTANGVSAVFVADANGSNRHRITPWGEWSTSAHWSPDGHWIVFDKVEPRAGGPHNLILVHPNGTGLKTITSTTSLGGVCCAVWSPSSSMLLTTASHHLIAVNRSGSGTTRLTSVDWQNGNFSGAFAWGR